MVQHPLLVGDAQSNVGLSLRRRNRVGDVVERFTGHVGSELGVAGIRPGGGN